MPPDLNPSQPERRFTAAEPHELDWPARRQRDEGPKHFLVGFAGGFAIGILTAVSCGWWPL